MKPVQTDRQIYPPNRYINKKRQDSRFMSPVFKFNLDLSVFTAAMRYIAGSDITLLYRNSAS